MAREDKSQTQPGLSVIAANLPPLKLLSQLPSVILTTEKYDCTNSSQVTVAKALPSTGKTFDLIGSRNRIQKTVEEEKCVYSTKINRHHNKYKRNLSFLLRHSMALVPDA